MGKAQQLFPSPPPLPLPRKRLLFVTLLFLTWSVTFTILSDDSLPPIKPTPSSDWLPTRRLSCTDSLWPDPATCGLNGEHCVDTHPPHTLLAFHCPAHCASTTASPQKHLVGLHELPANQPVIIGGPVYRGDSFICAAAAHAGILDDGHGGCGVLQSTGWTNSFPAVGSADGRTADSLEVKTYFPASYRFTVDSDVLQCPATRGDASWALPWVSAAHTALVWRATGGGDGAVRTLWSLAVLYAHLRLRLGQGFRNDWVYPAVESTVASSPVVVHVDEKEEEEKAVPVPEMLEPVIAMGTISNITFKWAAQSVPSDVEGISMLVDDIERGRQLFGGKKQKKKADLELRGEQEVDSLLWQRTPQAFVDYIRFGYVKGGKVAKYSPAGVWLVNGTWTGIPQRPV